MKDRLRVILNGVPYLPEENITRGNLALVAVAVPIVAEILTRALNPQVQEPYTFITGAILFAVPLMYEALRQFDLAEYKKKQPHKTTCQVD